MKKLTTFLSLLLLFSCGQQENKTNQRQIEKADSLKTKTTDYEITFYKVNSTGILLGDNIKLLDKNFKEIKDITYLNEQFVDITEVSDKYHKLKPTDDYCQEFKYIKIKTTDFEGYVDGRKIYEQKENTQNKIIKIDENEVSVITTSYFGVGTSDDDGLTGCSINTPIVFFDKSANYKGLVRMVKNKYYESDYPYFELKNDDMASDEIINIDKQGNKYVISIRRVEQEGGANMKVTISTDKNQKFVAEIIEYKSLEEEELQKQLKK